ncbi:hypothetical protein VPH35_000612 [Triticum aestivum]
METTAAVRNTSRRRANQLQVTVSLSCRSRPLPISVVTCALVHILQLKYYCNSLLQPIVFIQKVQSSIGLEATGEQLNLCLLFSKYSRAECYRNSLVQTVVFLQKVQSSIWLETRTVCQLVSGRLNLEFWTV